jgi:DNA-binding transcriptional LysR family regulator
MSFNFAPTLKALHSFEAAARLKSLTRAAAELGVSVSAVAFQVRQVEEGLGAKLLVRSGRSLEVTAEGQKLSAELRRAFAAIDGAVGAFRTAGSERRSVTVSMLSSFASLWLLPRLAAFRRRFPDIEVRISTTEAHADLAAGDIDCAIRCGPGGWEGVNAERLFPQRLAPLCHPAHPAAARREGAPLPPGRDLIVNALRDDEWAKWFAATGTARAEPPDAQPFEGRELVADAVQAGLGIGLMDVSVFAREIEAGELVQLGPAVETGWSHYLVRPAQEAVDEGVEAFRAWIMEEIAPAPCHAA